SISISGRDPLANVEYLCAALARATTNLPVMLDCDGQRPAEIAELRAYVKLVQITLDGSAIELSPGADRVFESLAAAASSEMPHALVLCADERTTDAQMLRVIERAHGASAATMIVV